MRQLMVSFEGATAPAWVVDAVRSGATASFCLFGFKNATTPDAMRALCDELYAAARAGGQAPPLIGLDQEGGQLMAIARGMTEMPGNMALGATRSPELAYAAGQVLARELLAMGGNFNFAPVLDVNSNPFNPAIGIRAFGDEPSLVGRLGAALIKGIQSLDVIAAAKHFPGSGDIQQDTHFVAPTLTHGRARLDAFELAPFREAIQAGVGAIMSAHVIMTAMDADNPATISRRVMTDLLRGELGFTGLTVTDAMDMHAVSVRGAETVVQQALWAGNDLVLLGHLDDQAGLMARSAHLADPAALARIATAQARVPQTLPDFSVLGSAAHQAVAREIAERAITQVKDDGTLPLRPHADDRIAVITAQPINLTPADSSAAVTIALAEIVRGYHPRTDAYQLPHHADRGEIAALVETVADAAYVIVGTINASMDEPQAALVRALHARGLRVIVIALRTPYDLVAFPMVGTYVCTYSIRRPAMEAVARFLFGEIEALGVLPCALPDAVP